MQRPSPHDALAAAIAGELAAGLRVDADTMRWIDATFADPDAGRLRTLLADADDDQVECLLELLLTPDEGVCARLEPAIETLEGQPPDPEWLARQLLSTVERVTVHLADGRGRLTIPMDGERMVGFVGRLGFDRALPDPLRGAVAGFCARQAPTGERGTDDPGRFKARIRHHTAGRLPDDQSRILIRLFEGLPPNEDAMPCLDMTLQLLRAPGAAADFEACLGRHRHWRMEALQRAVRQEQLMPGAPMEVRLAQGVRTLHLAADRTRAEIAVIERVAAAIYGRLPAPLPGPQSVEGLDLGGYDSRADLDRLCRLLM
jgi:hypothetical protein